MPIFAAAALIYAAAMPLAASADGLMGEWARSDGVAHARLAQCGDKLCMTNTRIQNSTNDEKVGDKVIITVKERSDDRVSGVAYDPKRDRSFTVKMKVEGARMMMSACAAGGMFCKTIEWTRLH